MIEVIIALINARLTALDLFKDIKGVCEQIQKVEGDNTLIYPAQWCGKDYDHIDSTENWEDGLAYHRQVGVNTEETGEESVNGCDEEVIRTYPMRVVCLIPKDKLTQGNNDQFIDDKLATNIANTLKIVNSSSISETLKAEGVAVEILSTQKDRYAVYEEEFTLPDGHVPKFEFSFFFIDYNIIINATQKCFDNFDCDGTAVQSFCEIVVTDSNNPASPVTLNDKETYTCFADETRILDSEFGTAGDDEITSTIGVNQAGTYTSNTLTNVATVVYEVDDGGGFDVVTLPFTVVNADILKRTITRTVAGVLSRVVVST